MDGRHQSRKICPCCGQDIVIPNDITSIDVDSAIRLIMFKLYRAMPKAVHQSKLGKARATVYANVSELRLALAASGLPYKVECVVGEGYRLVYLGDRKAA